MFIVVAIVIFGIFVSLSYTLFGKTLQPQMVDLFTESINTTKDYTESDFFTFVKSTGTIVDYDAEKGPKDVVIPETIDGVKVKNITNLAFSDKDINSLVLPENLETLIDGTYSQGIDPNTGELIITGRTGSFFNNNLKDIKLPESLKNIGERAFMFNELTEIVIPNNVKNINNGAFKGNKLTEVKIGTGVTSISSNAFAGNNLTEFYIPKNVEKIGRDMIAGNKNLKTVHSPRHLEEQIKLDPRTVATGYLTVDGTLNMPEIIYYD